MSTRDPKSPTLDWINGGYSPLDTVRQLTMERRHRLAHTLVTDWLIAGILMGQLFIVVIVF